MTDVRVVGVLRTKFWRLGPFGLQVKHGWGWAVFVSIMRWPWRNLRPLAGAGISQHGANRYCYSWLYRRGDAIVSHTRKLGWWQ